MIPILPQTTLCSIIRDEAMNPAGGIRRFIHNHAPHVEQIIIVDTGSIDGTREILEELKKEHVHLQVYDKKFTSYANLRNDALTKVKTKRVFILDADEVIRSGDFHWLTHQIKLHPEVWGFHFELFDVDRKGREKRLSNTHNPRLYSVENTQYETRQQIYEYLPLSDRPQLVACVPIFHFLPSKKGLKLKRERWYANRHHGDISPASIPGFEVWKQYNPHREKY